MKNHNVEAIANPGAARIAPQERMPGAMRVLYPAPEQNFQAKVWVGGDDDTFMECTNEKVKAVVGYLRSMDNRMTSTGTEYTTSTYQLQQWRNIDYSKPPANYDEKWQLIPLTLDKTSTLTYNLRKPRTEDTATTLTFYINADKFKDNDGSNYEYFVISFDKLAYKLHLLSAYKAKYPETSQEYNYTYTHIEEDLPLDLIFDDTKFDQEQLKYYDKNNNPLIIERTTLPASGTVTVNVPATYYDLEEEPLEERVSTDFVVAIVAKE